MQPRALADRCPGLLRPHVAEDGPLVRLRIPGGQTTSTVLRELSAIAAEYGEGSVQLTSRSNVQLRGLARHRMRELVERVAATGLLPSVTHERVRNIAASPLTGLPGTGQTRRRPDLRALVAQLDVAVCATPALVELPGRFLFAVDDGSRDVTGLKFDLAFRADDPLEDERSGSGTVLVGDARHGIPTATADAVDVMITLACRFLELRDLLSPRPWHIAELPEVGELDPRIQPVPSPAVPAAGVPLGVIGDAASVAVPLSLLSAGQIEAVHRATRGGTVVITPWRGLVLPGAAESLPALDKAGLIIDAASVWSQLTACMGAPGCARSAISTQSTAAQLVAALPGPPALPVHLSGCERRCGSPHGAHVDLVAPTSTAAALGEIGRHR